MSRENPIKLRNRHTPSKGGNDTSMLSQDYKNVVRTPIGKKRSNSGNSEVLTGRTTRKSNRMLQLSEKNMSATTTAAIIEQDGDESTCSSGTIGSNAENEDIIYAKENNENTPTKRVSKLSRNRSKSEASSKSFMIYKKSDDEQNNLKFTIRAQQASSDSTSTPRTREMSLRQSTIMRRHSVYCMDDTMSDEDDQSNVSIKRKYNATYFSKKDMGEYNPDSEDVDDEEEPQLSSEDDNNQEDDSSDDTTSEEENTTTTPKKGSVMMQDLSKLTLTPELLTRIEGSFVRRRIGVNSPVATSSQTMSPNPETYFLAENRIKYKNITNQPAVMSDAMKGKRRRKIKMGAEERLPERIPTDFSVTTEAMKATVTSENFISGNIHEEEVDQLFQNIVENEFPHWLGLFRDRFNVMLYGYGSKLSVLREFEKFVNNDYLTVTINGLFPKLNPRKFLYGICENINPEGHTPHGTNLEAVAKDAVKVLKTIEHTDVFILVSNFDTMVLRYPQMLAILCWLSQIPYIHILASCDTVNAFLGVTQSQALQLNFCWMHCPTYFSYREELKWIPGIFGNETKIVTQKSSLKYVLQSLTGNARKAFALLAQMQLKQMKSRAVQKSKETYPGVRFQELAKECREKFIAHSDENLRTLLVEFFDHKLIRQTGKGKHLENTLLIELDVETLEEIIPDLL